LVLASSSSKNIQGVKLVQLNETDAEHRGWEERQGYKIRTLRGALEVEKRRVVKKSKKKIKIRLKTSGSDSAKQFSEFIRGQRHAMKKGGQDSERQVSAECVGRRCTR